MITLQRALDVINAAIQSAKSKKLAVSVVIVDRGGHTIAAARDDSASYFSIGAAERKAVTSVNFGIPTQQLMEIGKGDPLLAGAVCGDNTLSIFPGGLPIKSSGVVVAALGVAGAHYIQDQAVAEEALAILGD